MFCFISKIRKQQPLSVNQSWNRMSWQQNNRFPSQIFTLSRKALSHSDGVWTLYSSNWADSSDNKPALVQQNLQEALLQSATHRWRSVTPFPSAAVHRFLALYSKRSVSSLGCDLKLDPLSALTPPLLPLPNTTRKRNSPPPPPDVSLNESLCCFCAISGTQMLSVTAITTPEDWQKCKVIKCSTTDF